MKRKTVGEVLEATVAEHGRLPAMKVKKAGTWSTTTWKEYRDQARTLAKAFIKLGLEPGRGVTIIGYNRPEWFLADVAAILAGGVPAGIYTSSSPEQCRYITDHCEAQVAVVENKEHLAKFAAVRDELPGLRAIIFMEGSDGAEGVLSWADAMKLGEDIDDADLDGRIEVQKPEDVCTLIYTSGTTGPPKAVMMTHSNLTWTAQGAIDAFEDLSPEDGMLSYLPLSHIAEQLLSLHIPMAFGGCTWFAESLEKLGDNLREVRPTVFLGVPRVWEKIQAKIVAAAAQNSALKRRIGAWARSVGMKAGYAEQQGKPKPWTYPIAHKLVFSKVREKLGLDRCRIAITSTAPTPRSTHEFFLSLGLPLYEVYGMSECTGPAAISLPGKYKTGSAGFAMDGCEIKTTDDGEVCMRGPNVFAGYLKNEEATRESLDEDGWLHSGDVGKVDADGFLWITDRKKEIIVTSGGKNISPQHIESQLKAIPVISQAVAVGDGRKFIAALIALDPERVAAEAQEAGSSARDAEAASEDDVFIAHLKKQIDAACEHLSRVESVKKFAILPEELSVDRGELTPTMKLKRRVIHERYAEVIDSFYE